ncbi:MAG: NAD(P)-binding domain-containing protein [Prolixibacteraceae bacterium]|jgi:thioredoxin reductase (NADPH)|nr:NAD(P)-binding domain-containing protein [Prolixibacteraceae bacterium]MBT6763689.1 NAD(P)-binding domain-containing protein [Prolixibacteraceae bacterium]MBT7000996.1 NAD(P)-binding domain-containing protein [Prolixibacteraceae bacterium]MBT7393716.1 NAD(P)-binding domain-containing protein [Prolixibacteraceae bacterium]
MDILVEKILIYGAVGLFLFIVVYIYIRKLKKESQVVGEKIKIAKEEGMYEPVSLHPVVDVNSCIQSGACIRACPEHDILGIRKGKARVINASQCVGHGACFHACPTEAISLHIGTEKRGVDLPHVNQFFESNVKGVFIAGEMGGMGLIKNSVEQGKQAVDNIVKGLNPKSNAEYGLIIVGAGPAGISASLEAKKHKIKALTLEQDSLGGTVFTFPRAKIVMTSAMDLPLHGKIKLFETSKAELLNLWTSVLENNGIKIHENKKVEQIIPENGGFVVHTKDGSKYTTQRVLLGIGRRGTPRKLNIPGEEMPNVAYRLLEPELIEGKKIVVVGGGDSAIESALLLADQNQVTLSYRKDAFSRLKPRNNQSLKEAIKSQKINVSLNSNLTSIEEKVVSLKVAGNDNGLQLENDLVYIFAGGELPTQFLKNVGINITRKFGEAILKHEK